MKLRLPLLALALALPASAQAATTFPPSTGSGSTGTVATPPAADNSTKIANTAWVQAWMQAGNTPKFGLLTASLMNVFGGESHFSNSTTFVDPQGGTGRSLKVSGNGIAYSGGLYGDTATTTGTVSVQTAAQLPASATGLAIGTLPASTTGAIVINQATANTNFPLQYFVNGVSKMHIDNAGNVIANILQQTGWEGASQVLAGPTYGSAATAPTWRQLTAQDIANVAPSASQTFVASGTWTKLAGAQEVCWLLVGEGGNGGSGATITAGNSGSGGGGGGGAGIVQGCVPATMIPATVTVTLPTVSAPVMNATGVSHIGTSFGTVAAAYSGGDGGPGNAGAQSYGGFGAGVANSPGPATATGLSGIGGNFAAGGGVGGGNGGAGTNAFNLSLGGGGAATSATGVAGSGYNALGVMTGAGGGGGLNAGVAQPGGSSGIAATGNATGGAATGAAGGTNATGNFPAGYPCPGGGGGGGNASGAGGVGGAGGCYGAPGGGGGSGTTAGGLGGQGGGPLAIIAQY